MLSHVYDLSNVSILVIMLYNTLQHNIHNYQKFFPSSPASCTIKVRYNCTYISTKGRNDKKWYCHNQNNSMAILHKVNAILVLQEVRIITVWEGSSMSLVWHSSRVTFHTDHGMGHCLHHCLSQRSRWLHVVYFL